MIGHAEGEKESKTLEAYAWICSSVGKMVSLLHFCFTVWNV